MAINTFALFELPVLTLKPAELFKIRFRIHLTMIAQVQCYPPSIARCVSAFLLLVWDCVPQYILGQPEDYVLSPWCQFAFALPRLANHRFHVDCCLHNWYRTMLSFTLWRGSIESGLALH